MCNHTAVAKVSAPYAFWLLMFVAMFTAAAAAQQAKEGDSCSPPNAKTQIVVAATDGKLHTKSCECITTWKLQGQDVYNWICTWD
jgi:hypothetical protein